jgi:hypothetical protein
MSVTEVTSSSNATGSAVVVAAAVSSVLMTAQWTGVRVGDIAAVEVAMVVAVMVLGVRPLWRFVRNAPWLLWLPVFTLVVLDVIPGGDDSQFVGVTTALSLVVCWYLIAEGRARSGVPWFSVVELLVWSALANAVVATVSAMTNGEVAWPWAPEFVDREVGLTTHPNQLALSCVVGLAFVLFVPTVDHAHGDVPDLRWKRPYVTAVASVLFLGVLVSGSRAGVVVSVGLVVAAVLVRRGVWRRSAPAGAREGGMIGSRFTALVFAGAVCVVGAVALVGLAGRSEASMEESDGLRRALLDDAAAQALGSPMLGAGSDHLLSAHNVPLQLLAAGGIVLLFAFVPMLWTAMQPAFSVAPFGPSVAVVAWFSFAMVQNPIVDRFVHLVIAVAVVAAQSRVQRPSQRDEPTMV